MPKTTQKLEKRYLLNTRQMATFVAKGFLRFDELVPADLNERIMREIDQDMIKAEACGTPLSKCYAGTAVREMLDMPEVRGMIQSLVGPDPFFDHQAVHVRMPNEGAAQGMHGDSIIDTRMAFDIQLMYFPHDTPLEMGGTLVVPGSHFRRINEMDIARYQNFLGQVPIVCKAGTLLVLHHGIWHCGRRNEASQKRYMFKIRLNPRVRQLKLWNTDDLASAQGVQKALYVRGTMSTDDIQSIFERQEPWFENATGRLEIVNRIKLWRHLTGDERFDAHYWMTRIENNPTRKQLSA
jgi:hypothetical protein